MNNVNLDQPLIEFNNEQVAWTIRDSFNGCQVLGGIGSGKSSGAGRFLALKYLAAGYGGLILSAKNELPEWQEYCRLTGREKDLLVVEPNGENLFNVLEYESARGNGKSFTGNIVNILKTVIRASEEKSSGKADDPFWETALDMLITNTIDLVLMAYGKLTLQQLYDIALSVTDESGDSAFSKALSTAKQKIARQIEEWSQQPGNEHLSALDDLQYNQQLFAAIPKAREFKLIDQFFIESFRNLSEKTRSVVNFSFTGFVFHLLKDPVFSLFFDKPSTFTPEASLEGKIILLHLPVKQYNKVGRDIQIMFKYIWQLAMEKRDVAKNGRPVFLWADEAQHFLHEFDAEFQATARSSRIATMYISQNLPNFYASMGGEKSQFRVKSLLGTLGTKIFCANADVETNQYASSLIGEAYQKEETETISSANGAVTTSQAVSVKLAKMVRAEEFNGMRTGGPHNNCKVTAYIHVQGKRFANGFGHKLITFDQNFTPQS